MQWKNAVRLSKLKPDKPKMVSLGLKTLMIVENGGEYHATEGLCRHMRWPLGLGGKVKDGCITCPLHQTRHRLDDGCLEEWSPFPLFPPYGKLVGKMSKKKDLPLYETKIEGDYLQVRI
tara:strand:+ start:102 stop:458 length:357 start_codon:yes stop_codon:yes gene_type:complete